MIKGLIVAGALLFAAGCGSSNAAKPAKTVTSAPSPTAVAADASARAACSQLAVARIQRVGSETEEPADGYGASTSEMKATAAELKAMDLALKSSVSEVRQAGDVAALQSWCQAHHL